MTFLPIVDRELRVAARRHSTYWVRLLLAMASIVIGFFLYLGNIHTSRAHLAREIFGGLGFLGLVYGLASGRRFTADCLSEEKREGTLGLLFLTDLKGYDVVLGKLAANSLDAFYGAIAVLPILAIPLLLGGVTLGELQRMALIAVNALFFSLTLGICISAISRSGRKAAAATFLIILLCSALLPAIGAWINYSGRYRGLEQYFYMPSVWC